MSLFEFGVTRKTQTEVEDEYLFGWDPLPGIVSVWANREGKALLWRREDGQIKRSNERFYPWLFAAHLDDLEHLQNDLQPARQRNQAKIRYHQLNGPTNSFRYVLLADDGRDLEQALCYGASQRLGKQIKSIHALEKDYYRVGPVEQYLMQTGRTYFRGLNYEDLHRLQFDLETTALDPHRGRIFLVSILDNQGFSTILEAPEDEDEKLLIQQLCKIIRERDPDVIENHNLFGFDLPFLEHRAVVRDVPLHLARMGGPKQLEHRQETLAIGPEARNRTRYSIAGRELIDTLDAVRKHDFVVRDMPGHGLKAVAKYFGIASEQRVYLAGNEIYETYKKTPELVRHYALDDVREVDGLSKRLLGAPFALASMAPRRYERLASAGPAMGILEPILVRSYLHADAALPRQSHKDSATGELHEGGAVHLFASGIAEHVVKADVASLYPSLMRTFQIGPKSDRLHVLLHILGRLTDLRLAHKAEAKAAETGEANHHEATQAAMKILINAAYGYMGAGEMALFADSKAASEVTRRGREILNQVLDALRKRGMALIEADTDGVYFAVPPNWSEEQERTLVHEIGTELPLGIRLEYEGRYRAMFSHEVKNYALLTYDNRLVVHGVAMRSSRVEPFGERFLREALPKVMVGDIIGLYELYQETAKTIRERKLPAIDLATRVRLSKTPEEYFALRSKHQEVAYETLLAAGRNKWYPGERVRFYRARNKRSMWIPEENDNSSIDNDWQNEESNKSNAGKKREAGSNQELAERRDYDIEHYLQVLLHSYAARLRKAFAAEDFEQLFRLDSQVGLFDQPIEGIEPLWIR